MTGKHLHFSCIWFIHIRVISHHFSLRVPHWTSPYLSLALRLSFIPTLVRAVFGTGAKTKSLAPNTLEYGCGSLTFRYWMQSQAKPSQGTRLVWILIVQFIMFVKMVELKLLHQQSTLLSIYFCLSECVRTPWKDIYFGSISHFVCLARIISFIVRWNTNKAQPRCARAWARTDKKYNDSERMLSRGMSTSCRDVEMTSRMASSTQRTSAVQRYSVWKKRRERISGRVHWVRLCATRGLLLV